MTALNRETAALGEFGDDAANENGPTEPTPDPDPDQEQAPPPEPEPTPAPPPEQT